MQEFSNIFFRLCFFTSFRTYHFFQTKQGIEVLSLNLILVVENHSFRHSTTLAILFSFNVLALFGGCMVTKVRCRVCADARDNPIS